MTGTYAHIIHPKGTQETHFLTHSHTVLDSYSSSHFVLCLLNHLTNSVRRKCQSNQPVTQTKWMRTKSYYLLLVCICGMKAGTFCSQADKVDE